MKIVTRTIMTLALIVIANVSFAGGSNNPVITATSAKTFTLRLFDVKGNVRYIIRDSEQHILYEEQIDEQNYGKSFDIKGLEKGEYQIELRDEVKTQVVPFTVMRDTFEFYADEKELLYHPVVIQKDRNLTVYKKAPHSETIKITLLDSKSNLLTEQVITGTGVLGKNFNLNALESGKYILNINTNQNLHTERIEVQ